MPWAGQQNVCGEMSQEGITSKVVAEASLRLLDSAGVDAVSLAAVASEVGCPVHIVKGFADSQDALLDLACDRIYAEVDLRPLDAPWPERLRTYARSFRQALLRHPRAATLMATRPIVSISSMAVAERALAEFTGAGLTPPEANRTLLVIVSFVTGHALTEIGSRHHELGGHTEREVDSFRRGLPKAELPVAARAVSHVDRDAEFELGMKFIIDGLERKLLHSAPE